MVLNIFSFIKRNLSLSVLVFNCWINFEIKWTIRNALCFQTIGRLKKIFIVSKDLSK